MSLFPKCNIDCGLVFESPILPVDFIVILFLVTPVHEVKLISYPLSTVKPKFLAPAYNVLSVSNPPILNPPAYTYDDAPLVIAPVVVKFPLIIAVPFTSNNSVGE